MSGYPAKVKSLDWVGDTPFLATSGADEAICWPFDGKFGPMERSPVCVAHNRKKLATFVRGVAWGGSSFCRVSGWRSFTSQA